MNTLYQHIEHLLLSHDCVVVPHFGGFVAHEADARYVEAEALFFPPVRLVRFNPDLTIGDDLLLNHICRFYNFGESEGKRAIQTMVHQLRGQLLAEGQVDFGSLGIFSQDEDGDIQFSACQAGATTPALYGLDAFMMPRLAERKPASRIRRKALSHESRKHDFITFSISRRAIRNTLATAAVLLAVALFSVPLNLIRRHHLQTASLFPTEAISLTHDKTVQTKQPAAEPISMQAKTDVSATGAVQETAKSTPQATVHAAENNFAVVFASNVSLKNAERYVSELAVKGIGDAHVMTSGKTIRVIVDGIATENEAYNQVREFRAMGAEFADVWVLKL